MLQKQHTSVGVAHKPAKADSHPVLEALAPFVGGAILIALAVRNIRRRRRMTPDQRNAEDMLTETRRLRRAIERQQKY
jgi:hypothetical protein